MLQKSAVAVIIKNEKGQILLSQRGPAARDGQGLWENVGGEIDPGETAEMALKREVKEEIGVDLLEIEELFHQTAEPNESNTVWTSYVYQGKIEGEPKIMEPDQCTKLKWININELNSLPLTSYAAQDFSHLGWLKLV